MEYLARKLAIGLSFFFHENDLRLMRLFLSLIDRYGEYFFGYLGNPLSRGLKRFKRRLNPWKKMFSDGRISIISYCFFSSSFMF